MHTSPIITLVLFLGWFLLLTSLLQAFSKKTAFPYTVAVLLSGLITQLVVHFFHIDLHLILHPNTIYYIILPLLLFESAMKINFHQFHIQFKTITFLATFGLLVSIFVIGIGASLLLGLPLGISLLFGALISATDPISVLALFQSLGAPKRLALIAEGESMFNDATAVILFRIISAFALINQAISPQLILHGLSQFVYIFIGSLVLGTILGYLVSTLIAKINNDLLIETTLTVALALSSFIIAEHFFHLSGVIATVMAGLTLGHFGQTRISTGVVHFMREFWEYIGFFAISLVFFFASFNLDFATFIHQPHRIFIIIVLVLLARLISVYISFAFSNHFNFFRNEPNVPMSWQHIINWGGLRGVIPLVLVYSLPTDFPYLTDLLSFTLGTLLFTLLINGLTIKSLLVKLRLHLPRREETILTEENTLFTLEQAEDRLRHLSSQEFDPEIIRSVNQELSAQEQLHKQRLLDLIDTTQFQHSLELQSLTIERKTLLELLTNRHITENIFTEYQAELDLQQDALEYPEVYTSRGVEQGGFLNSRKSFRRQLRYLKSDLLKSHFIQKLLRTSEEQLIEERFGLLKARIVASAAVLSYLDHLLASIPDRLQAVHNIQAVKDKYLHLQSHNQQQLTDLSQEFPLILKQFQQKQLHSLVWNLPSSLT